MLHQKQKSKSIFKVDKLVDIFKRIYYEQFIDKNKIINKNKVIIFFNAFWNFWKVILKYIF